MRTNGASGLLLSMLAGLLLGLAASGCSKSAHKPLKAEAAKPPSGSPAVSAPSGRLIFQPAFAWANKKISHQGTGFFTKGPKGEIVGVTSAHFVDFDGPALLGVIWTDIVSDAPVARFRQSYGNPGRRPPLKPMDCRVDYLLVCDDSIEFDGPILEFDERLVLDKHERIWMPDKDHGSPNGYRLVAGTVVESHETHSVVRFDVEVKPQSQSGSPFISQKTGKVVGTWSNGGRDKQGLFINLAPAHALVRAMRDGTERPMLREVVGRPPEQSTIRVP